MDIFTIGSWRVFVGATALLLAATSTLSSACMTMSTEFGVVQHRFFLASKKGDIAKMQGILQRSDLTLTDNVDGKTWTQWAIIENRPNALTSLLSVDARPEASDDEGGNAILDAAGHKNPKWLKVLLSNGADPNVRHVTTGTTPLREALMANRHAQFRMLIEAKADLKSTDSVGNTPLHIAAQINKPWHVLDLLKAGADPAARNSQGQTFQRYLFMTKDELLNAANFKGRQAVLAHMSANGIAVEKTPPE